MEHEKTVRLIVECEMDGQREQELSEIGRIVYVLPMIGAYVVELPEANVPLLKKMGNLRQIDQASKITAQMNAARKTMSVDKLFRDGQTGRGVTIAILDTGVSPVDDLRLPRNRLIAFKDFVNGKGEAYDDNGHGTHVAGIAAGNGLKSDGKYAGVAPEADIVAVKVLDEEGCGNSADVLAGLQWVLNNREKYRIRVCNLSVGTMDAGNRDPLVRAVEAAWDAGIVMTVAAGNNGPMPSTVTSPGVSRKVITVGASDDSKSVMIWGDTLQNFSGRGPTQDCIMKPDVVAPGADIVSCLTLTPPAERLEKQKGRIVSPHYIKMSGTSMSTPMVAGAAALLLQKYHDLKPNDIKMMLKLAAVAMNYPPNQQGWGLINIDKLLREDAVHVG